MKHSVAYLQDLIPTLASKYVLPKFIAAKVEIKSCRYLRYRMCFICACMDVTS